MCISSIGMYRFEFFAGALAALIVLVKSMSDKVQELEVKCSSNREVLWETHYNYYSTQVFKGKVGDENNGEAMENNGNWQSGNKNAKKAEMKKKDKNKN